MTYPRIVLLAIFCILLALPFFEGGETPAGLLLIHTCTFVLLCSVLIASGSIFLPRFLLYFLPYFGVLVLGSVIAPYKYSAFMLASKNLIAALFSISLFTVLREYRQRLMPILFYAFLICCLLTIVTALFWHRTIRRVSGTFINANDFACFALLLFVFGLFLYEKASQRLWRIMLGIGGLLLAAGLVLAASRSIFVAVMVFAGLSLYQKRPSTAVKVVLGSLILAAGVAVGWRLFQEHDPLLWQRFRIWKHTLQAVLINPYLGVGLNMLQYNSPQFNFPSPIEVARFGWVARSADNQYLQILAETGFVGLFTFLIGWIALFFDLRTTTPPFRLLVLLYPIMSLLCLFMLPLNVTSILFLFLALVLLPLAATMVRPIEIRLTRGLRVVGVFLALLLLAACVAVPFAADSEFRMAAEAKNAEQASRHVKAAIRLNPFQPYYRFLFLRRVVDSKPTLSESQWLTLAYNLDLSIRLNPLEPEFYLYKARIFRNLQDLTGKGRYYVEAADAYHASLERDPYNVFVRAEYAIFEAQRRRLSRAEEELKTAIEYEPAFLNAHLFLVQVLAQQGKTDQARKEFRRLTALERQYRHTGKSNGLRYTQQLLEIDERQVEQVGRQILDTAGS